MQIADLKTQNENVRAGMLAERMACDGFRAREKLLAALRTPVAASVELAVFATAENADWFRVVMQILNGHREEAVGRATNPADAARQAHWCGGADALTFLRTDLLKRAEKGAAKAKQ